MEAIFTRKVQVIHSHMVERLTLDSPAARTLATPFSLSNATGLTALNHEVTRQAAMISYNNVYHLMFVVTALLAPFVLVLRSGKAPAVERVNQPRSAILRGLGPWRIGRRPPPRILNPETPGLIAAKVVRTDRDLAASAGDIEHKAGLAQAGKIAAQSSH